MNDTGTKIVDENDARAVADLGPTNPWKIGDAVTLRADSRVLLVEQVHVEDIRVVWFDANGMIQRATLDYDLVDVAPEKPKRGRPRKVGRPKKR